MLAGNTGFIMHPDKISIEDDILLVNNFKEDFEEGS